MPHSQKAKGPVGSTTNPGTLVTPVIPTATARNDMYSVHPAALTGNNADRKRSNVISFGHHAPVADPNRAFKSLTHALVMAQHRAGTLHPAVLEALLVGVGLEP